MAGQSFDEHRPSCTTLPNIRGSLREADEAVNEAWLRLSLSDANPADDLAEWRPTSSPVSATTGSVRAFPPRARRAGRSRPSQVAGGFARPRPGHYARVAGVAGAPRLRAARVARSPSPRNGLSPPAAGRRDRGAHQPSASTPPRGASVAVGARHVARARQAGRSRRLTSGVTPDNESCHRWDCCLVKCGADDFSTTDGR